MEKNASANKEAAEICVGILKTKGVTRVIGQPIVETYILLKIFGVRLKSRLVLSGKYYMEKEKRCTIKQEKKWMSYEDLIRFLLKINVYLKAEKLN